jgi:hypothetical protein
MKESERIAAELAAAKKEAAGLPAQIATLEARLEKLTGGWRRETGIIAHLEQDLQAATIAEADALLPTVRRIDDGNEKILVVRKITPKRIYLAHPGNPSEYHVGHDGKDWRGNIHPDDLKKLLGGTT